MAEAGGWPYRFALIPLGDLFVDEAYQRPLSSFAKRIKNDYDPAMVGTLIISDRGAAKTRRRFAIIDGQTRWMGMGEHEDVAPCLVYEGLTRKQEAELFARLQTERRGMATWIRYRAALISDKPEAKEISRVTREEGFKVAGDGDERGIRSIAALEWLYRRSLLRDVLRIVRESWGAVDGSEKSTADARVRGEILQGIGRFLKDTDNVDEERLIRNLAAITPEQLRHRANALREGSGSSGNYSLFIRDALVGVYATRSRAASVAATA